MATLSDLRHRIRSLHLAEETGHTNALLAGLSLGDEARQQITDSAAQVVEDIRQTRDIGLMEVFLAEYGLSSSEGIALMCLAEALLRVPDARTIDDLIEDKLSDRHWSTHLGQSDSTLVNASTWALMLTGRVLAPAEERGIGSAMRALAKRLGEPVIRTAVRAAMKEMGNQFVLGETIAAATTRAKKRVAQGYTHSYDMLGEAAMTEPDALGYVASYADAIAHLSGQCPHEDVRRNPGISIKLSALFPRYEEGQRAQALNVLVARTLELTLQARAANMGLNIDAEEADRLDLSLDIIQAVLADPRLEGWDGFGVVVQAYGKRALAVIDWLDALATSLDRKIMVRLVKGAYWDTEIKHAQVEGFGGFPVFTHKSATDISYLACARRLLEARARIYPQFATHNARSVLSILHMAPEAQGYEFQRLHGMGGALYDHIRRAHDVGCRIYAPVGVHDDLLAYLVRRLLENGANSSFVNQLVDRAVPAVDVVRDPITEWEQLNGAPNPAVTDPADLFQPQRVNSTGFDLTSVTELTRIDAARDGFAQHQWSGHASLVSGTPTGPEERITNPADPSDQVGVVQAASGADVAPAVAGAQPWTAPQADRAQVLNRAADLYEEHFGELFALLTREAGKTLKDGVAELREAVDFLRYYAAQSAALAQTAPLGRVVCISPWNFPLAIFTGQIAAALATGNAVLAKPAEATPLVALRATQLLHAAGVPATALQLLIGTGAEVGAALAGHPGIDGLCFTGSTATARHINRAMADTGNPRAPLIAETGGLNAMVVDSTALPQQAIRDILASSFQSAGQRCSALRVLYVQDDIADSFLTMLTGAMETQVAGAPWALSTDIGPVIDTRAATGITAHIEAARAEGRVLFQGKVPGGTEGAEGGEDAPEGGTFVPPTLIRVTGIGDLTHEIFGPVLHVARYQAKDLDKVIEAVNGAGYGLTFGVHSRIDSRIAQLCDGLRVGNIYVNRNQIGAVVGSQPFGGEGLSGTGPKAGGPRYLPRFTQADAAPEITYPEGTLTASAVSARLAQTQRPADGPLHKEAMQGPTGEMNQLSSHPRGKVLCLGPGIEAARDQAEAVHRAGSAAIVIAPGATAKEGLDGTLPIEALGQIEGADAVVLWADAATQRRARLSLATRTQGPLTPLIDTTQIAERVTLERHICIDTTAAGGNTDLLAAGGTA